MARALRLRSPVGTSSFDVHDAADVIGAVRRTKLFQRDVRIRLPATLPLAARLFVFAVAAADWRSGAR